ncbi:hypothetical protein [Parafrankia colletiae]|nr:hypothetical protein [Parafrankia colletiae]
MTDNATDPTSTGRGADAYGNAHGNIAVVAVGGREVTAADTPRGR